MDANCQITFHLLSIWLSLFFCQEPGHQLADDDRCGLIYFLTHSNNDFSIIPLLVEISLCCQLNSNQVIAAKFCTWHGSCIMLIIWSAWKRIAANTVFQQNLGPGCTQANFDDLVQDYSISIADALEILQSCTKPLIWTLWTWWMNAVGSYNCCLSVDATYYIGTEQNGGHFADNTYKWHFLCKIFVHIIWFKFHLSLSLMVLLAVGEYWFS